jgi:histone H3/H4
MARTKQVAPKKLSQGLDVRELVRNIAMSMGADVRFTASASAAIQDAAEEHLAGILEESNCAASLSKRDIVTKKDIRLAERIRGYPGRS